MAQMEETDRNVARAFASVGIPYCFMLYLA